LRCDPCAGIEDYVLPSPRAGGDIALVPFVEAGDECSSEDRDGGPAWNPFRAAHRGQGCAPGAEEQSAENCVSDDVAAFANVKVPGFETQAIDPEKKMQDGIKDAAGVVRRQQRARFDGDDDEPENRSDPRLENVVTVGVQMRGLLDAIIGSLAGDHDIVNVALAESGAADAHEARLLQQFGNGGATAVAHA
jgi:hypothetical protein